MTTRALLIIAAASGALAVALGAFGAHGLRDRLGAEALGAWETAVLYHLTHSLAAALAATLALALAPSPGAGAARLGGWLFVAGVVLFSGSLYALSLGGPRVLGPVTPLGGLAFIGGWLALLAAALRWPG